MFTIKLKLKPPTAAGIPGPGTSLTFWPVWKLLLCSSMWLRLGSPEWCIYRSRKGLDSWAFLQESGWEGAEAWYPVVSTSIYGLKFVGQESGCSHLE